MSIENIKQGSVITDKVSLLLRNGENEKALDLLGQNYGPLARNAMEKVMKYSNLSQDEMVRVFGKYPIFWKMLQIRFPDTNA